MEAVNVFFRVDGEDDFLFIDLRRRRRLNEDSVDFRVLVEGVDDVENLLLSGIFRKHDFFGIDAEFTAFFDFGGDIDLGCGIVADEHDRETGTASIFLCQFLALARVFRVYRGGDRLAVDDDFRHYFFSVLFSVSIFFCSALISSSS